MSLPDDEIEIENSETKPINSSSTLSLKQHENGKVPTKVVLNQKDHNPPNILSNERGEPVEVLRSTDNHNKLSTVNEYKLKYSDDEFSKMVFEYCNNKQFPELYALLVTGQTLKEYEEESKNLENPIVIKKDGYHYYKDAEKEESKIKVAEGINVNKILSANCESPLHICAKNNSELCCAILLRCGIHKDPLNKNNQTPVHLAVIFNAVQTLHLLLKFGCNISAVDIMNLTPMEIAVQNLHEDSKKRRML